MSKINVLTVGSTGFVGGETLSRLLASPHKDSFTLSALVRSPEKAAILKDKFGVNAIVGSTADHAKLSELVESYDVVFNHSDCDDLALANAFLAGFKRHFEKTGKTAALIHTSGTAVALDDARGNSPSDVVYSDTDIAQLATISPSALHRNVDLAYINADKEGYVRTYIVSPGLVYGLASGPLVDAGIQNKHSIVVPAFIKSSVDRGQSYRYGKGLNIWGSVGLGDLADLFTLLFHTIITDPSKAGHGAEGYYWGTSDEYAAVDIANEIGRVLHKLGKVQTSEVSELSQDELNKYWGGFTGLGGNARTQANRSRALGWKPKTTSKDMLASIEQEAKSVLGL